MKHPKRGHKERGAAAVEMAIVLPLLLLIVFGIIDFGRLLYTKVELSSAAREGARIVAINDPSAGGLAADVQTRVDASQSLSGPVAASITSDCDTTDLATVTAQATFSWITPMGPIADMFTGGGSVGNSDLTISAEGTMRCGG